MSVLDNISDYLKEKDDRDYSESEDIARSLKRKILMDGAQAIAKNRFDY